MKVCQKGLNNIWIDYSTGSVRMCGWAYYRIGNLCEQTIEELWNGDKAEKFRESLRDGSYRYCDHKECPYCANENRELVEYDVPEYPKAVSLSYEETCNYVCVFCREKKYIPSACDKANIQKVEGEILKFIDKVDEIGANGVGEVFCSPSILKLLSTAPLKDDVKVCLETNGSLFNEENWKKIQCLEKYDLTVTVTVHSFVENTYQFLSGTQLPVSNIINNLKFIQSLRECGKVNRFGLATVLCEYNFREMPDFVRKCLEFNPDNVRLRYYKPYGVRPLAVEWFFDIRKPTHPYYNEYLKVMQDNIFKHPKVWKWQGETISDYVEHPYFGELKKINALTGLLLNNEAVPRLNKYFSDNNIKAISLYGNCNITEAIIKLMATVDCKIISVLETRSNGGEVCGLPLFTANAENVRADAVIILVPTFMKVIKEKLSEIRYKGKVMSLDDLINIVECNG